MPYRGVAGSVITSRLSWRRAGKTRTLIPVWDSSGESQFNLRLGHRTSPKISPMT
jgi:hypothetical protein